MRRGLLGVVLLAGCSGPSKPKPKAPDPVPDAPAAATCDDVGKRAGELSPDHPELVGQSRQNCLDEHWPADTITCVAGAPTLDVATACLTPPEPALCAPLREIVAAGADGSFTAIRGAVFDAEDPYRFEPTLEPPDNTGCEITVYGSTGMFRCQMVHTPDREALNAGYLQVAQAVQQCLPTWTPTQGDDQVSFDNPELDQVAKVYASVNSGWFDVYLSVAGTGRPRQPATDATYDDDDDAW